jgi:hypothetical protein
MSEERRLEMAIVGAASFIVSLSVVGSATPFRLATAAVPNLVVAFALLQQTSWRVRTSVVLACCLAAGVLFGWVVARSLRAERLPVQLPTGRALFSEPQKAERYRWLAARTRPGEYLLDSSYQSFFPLLLKNAADVQFFANTEYTRPEQVPNAIAGLKLRVRYVLWSREETDGFRPTHRLDPPTSYIEEHYRPVHSTGSWQMWELESRAGGDRPPAAANQ